MERTFSPVIVDFRCTHRSFLQVIPGIPKLALEDMEFTSFATIVYCIFCNIFTIKGQWSRCLHVYVELPMIALEASVDLPDPFVPITT